MKILYSVSYKDALNPFLKTITDAIKHEMKGVVFDFDSDSIWNDRVYSYDVLHIMWPEFLINDIHSDIDLMHRLTEIKSHGVRIVSTCHNLEPHYCIDKCKRNAISVAYSLSDTIHHLGQFSIDILSKKYPNVKHELIPHHVYDNLYYYLPTKEEACMHLGLSAKNDYILCLGAIRDEEEINLIKYVAKNLNKGVKLIAPSLILEIGGRYDLKKRLNYYLNKFIINHNRLISNIGFISNEELPFYLAISSISLIHRLKILNSGNLTLGMLSGNVIIGPETGNVGGILKDTENFTFKKQEDIPLLINQARNAFKIGKGINNRKFVLSNWTSSIIAKKILESYNRLLA